MWKSEDEIHGLIRQLEQRHGDANGSFDLVVLGETDAITFKDGSRLFIYELDDNDEEHWEVRQHDNVQLFNVGFNAAQVKAEIKHPK